ncbi:hypothetical protein DYB30_002821 [Aphanomyces astaci]|uniref:F-box domain-containing protein n=1 Tax=Aphanomyces astaci TaxID=112090 RepID=A0A397DLD7_APHAT|nr:hypothetical protein DYB30_002821 [Aphanomyces astaci]RHZ05617.1 hypothetical protein DYB26_011278 [Aphanomyces astaci]
MPPEIIHRIASFLSDGQSFVNYVDALNGTDTLGGLEPFTKLTGTIAPNDLWPELHLRAHHGALLLQVTAAIAPYFSIVHMHDMYDLSAFHGCPSSSSLGIRIERCPSASEVKVPLSEWYNQLARLPVAALAWEERSGRACPDQVECLLATLPRLPALQSLDLNGAIVPSVDVIFEFIASSHALVELSMRSLSLPDLVDGVFSRPTITAIGMTHLVHWLQRQPVRHLSLSQWHIDAPIALVLAFHRALWSSTLTRLVVRDSRVPHLDLHVFANPLAMSELELSGCGLEGADIVALSKGLRHSRVTKLVLSHNHINRGIPALAAALPTAHHLHTLVLSSCGLFDDAIPSLVQSLASCTVTALNLSCNAISAHGASLIVHAMMSKADGRGDTRRGKLVLMLHGNSRIADDTRQHLRDVTSACTHLKLFV